MSYEHIDNNQIVHNLSYIGEIIRKRLDKKAWNHITGIH